MNKKPYFYLIFLGQDVNSPKILTFHSILFRAGLTSSGELKPFNCTSFFAFSFHLLFGLLRPSLQMSIHTIWQSRWSQCIADGNKLGQLRPTIGLWQSSCHRNRHQDVILAHLSIGHTRLTHSYIIALEAPTICTSCRVRLSTSHILVDCPHYHTIAGVTQ